MKKNVRLWLGVIGVIFWCCQVKAAVVQSGTCGGECTWTLDDQGVFSTVNGSTATGEFDIPEGTKTISNSAFYNASGLTKITIPQGCISIGAEAFRGASGVAGNLNIPEGVISIGARAFYDMSGVTGNLHIPDSVTSIGINAFTGMNGVTGEFKIPNGMTSIGNNTFYGLRGLTSLTIPASVTSITNYAFNGMSFSEVFLSADSTLTDEQLTNAKLSLNKIVRYTADGQYMKDGKVYASLEDYRAGTTFVYNEAKGKYQKMDRDGVLLDGYYNADGSKLKYRIYTVEEAEEALGKNNKNTFSIRYR